MTKKFLAGLGVATLAIAATQMTAQTLANDIPGERPVLAVVLVPGAGGSSSSGDANALPEAPSALLIVGDPQRDARMGAQTMATMPPQDPPKGHDAPVAPLRWKYIPAGYAYQHVSQKDKVYIGFRDLYSVGNFGAMFLSAGWEHLNNSAPNYGTDKGAFGQRLGAAAITETAQGVFTDSVFSPLFHEDPRYFVEGDSHSFVNRVFHVVTRVFITRTDAGGHSVNAALLVGYATTTALQSAYYPQINRTFKDGISDYGGSLGGAALGFAFDEFASDLLEAVHLKKKP